MEARNHPSTKLRSNMHSIRRATLFAFLLAICSWSQGLHAQIGIGLPAPAPSSMLHVATGAGNNKGLIAPSILTASRIILDSTQNIGHGMLFFDQSLQKLHYFHKLPTIWRELDTDWYRSDVQSASPVIGTNLYLGVSGNVGIGTVPTDDPNAKVTVVGDFLMGNANWVQDSTPNINNPALASAAFGHWLGIGTVTVTSTSERLKVAGNALISGDVAVTATVTANRFFGEGVAPVGSISCWSGTISGNFDSNGEGIGDLVGWALCDGRSGRPDLRGRFLVGKTNNLGQLASPAYNNSEHAVADYNTQGDFGGEASITLTINELAAHDHTGTATASGSGHDHSYQHADDYEGYVGAFNSSAEVFQWGDFGTYDTGNPAGSNDGGHSHDIIIDDTGGGQPHENRPPYYALAYIIKLP